MSHDHQYIRNLVQLREGPRVAIIWLLFPWAVGLWWSAGVARALLGSPPAPSIGWAFVFTAIVGRFLLVGGLGFVATWAWLYFAWPDHPRVLCWATAVGFVGLWIWPERAIAVVPVFVALCMCGAILEQLLAGREREASDRAPLRRTDDRRS